VSNAIAGYQPNWVALEGAVNVRDLGGLRTLDGRIVRHGGVLRGDVPVDLTPPDVRALVVERGLRTVFDLRSAAEVTADGTSPLADGIDGHAVRTRHVPLLTALPPTEQRPKPIGLDYPSLANRGAQAMVIVLTELATLGTTASLVHCTAGKDRTGVLIAVLLELLGVDRELVIADYMATAQRLDQVVERSVRRPSAQANPIDPRLLGLVPDGMLDMLAMLDEHGGALPWLTAHGAAPDLAERLRSALLVDP
jgi:hypothetical protein